MGQHHIQILCIRILHQWGHEKWIKITPNCQIWIIYTGYGVYGMEKKPQLEFHRQMMEIDVSAFMDV